ncbi:hypothetical protein CAPTEDRAFT_151507 [Capitella teleta]|uniref:PPC domain-containing protein n=1 Tax=Capitella teleta TaxID=283909 RepID=R7TTS0_CAPTE|nr:hypothetical protein CAPTEDRAFT_151507 [Capitella teleta]|eukprot:ELT97084.1 hypothetical protein CAPTEDRAFT_151507 [Capitella teleta]
MSRPERGLSSPMTCFPLRLHPGEDLITTLQEFAQKQQLRSAFVLSCCGSVTKATLRFAQKDDSENEIRTFNEHFEILALSGTLSAGEGHLHVALGDKEGKVIGGHVIGDMPIFTTAEVVIAEMPSVEFQRPFDRETGYPELHIVKKSEK